MPRSALRYSAKLLFQFRVVSGRKANARRICEERIVTFKARDSEAAWKTAQSFGMADQFKYRNDAGGVVRFEYLGIMELLHRVLSVAVQRRCGTTSWSASSPAKGRLRSFLASAICRHSQASALGSVQVGLGRNVNETRIAIVV
jgi:hypothetical protein